MKTLFLFIAILFSTLGFAQETEGISIEISIDNILNNKGKIILALHTSETFMKGPGILNEVSSITDGKVTVSFKNVKPGTYAVIALHDENENNRMDFQDNGMPKESYGSSNNPMAYGPPQFSESKFDVSTDNLKMDIRF